MHLGRSGIGEADVDVVRQEHVTQAIGTVHVDLTCHLSTEERWEIVSFRSVIRFHAIQRLPESCSAMA